MIIIYHNNYTISEIVSTNDGNIPIDIKRNIVETLFYFAEIYKDEKLVWCHEYEKSNLNILEIEKIFYHKKLLYSYNAKNYFDSRIGYIDDSPYVNINKEVKYGTWQMSSLVGAVHASVINACKNDLKADQNFDYFLNSFAKRVMIFGIFCYSYPKLLVENHPLKEVKKATIYELFKFTKQHYRTRWVFLLFLNIMFFEKKFPFLPFLVSLFYNKRSLNSTLLDQIPLDSNVKFMEQETIDVLIPTIGRKNYLLDVLNNLSSQTYLPTNVIIVEQNPAENSQTELDFIQNQEWPFVIKHHFTHQTGVCNARNIGLSMIESEFCFFADDDIVFDNDLLQIAMHTFQSTHNESFLIACHLISQSVISNPPRQFAVFGAGHAFVKSSSLSGLKFNLGYEFGFGEDNDFGMQLRNKGNDILYISSTKIFHLKAPIGGFRTKPFLKWQNDEVQPKPSPTIMLFNLYYNSKEQLSNYKTTLFFKNLNSSFFINPIKYLKIFKQKWKRSVYWANQLKNEQQ